MKYIPLLARLLLTTVLIGGIVGGGYFYIKKHNPGVVLGTTNEVKDFIEDKLPQSKNILDKIIPEKESTEQDNQSSQETTDNTDLEAENKFLKDSLEMTQKQIETLTQKSIEVKDHLLNLTNEIKESSDSSKVHEKAFEYGQYLYCQQVVKEYEAK